MTARLARLVGDLGAAEDLAQDTFLAALARWTRGGMPDNPGAWLHTTARYLAIDLLHRRDALPGKYAALGPAPDAVEVDFDGGLDDVGDDLPGLMFMACYPVLSPEARVALTLRLLAGLTTAEIARPSWCPRRRSPSGSPGPSARSPPPAWFELPSPAERADRLASVLEVVYLVFNEGYAATAGDALVRGGLAGEAMRLGRVLTTLGLGERPVRSASVRRRPRC